MFLEDFACGLLGVLRADRQNHAALLQALHVLLKGKISLAFRVALAQADSAQAIVSNDSSPKGVVEVQHQTLLGQPPLRNHDGRQAVRVIDQVFRCAGHFGLMDETRIVPVPAAPGGS